MTAVRAKPIVPLDLDVYTLAKQRLVETFDRFDHVVASFSGGKDSTVVLNVALEVLDERPDLAAKHSPLRTVFYDEECIPIETDEYVRRIGRDPRIALEWYCLPVQHRNACSRTSPYWWPWAPEDREKWARPLPPEAITELDGFPIWPAEARLSIPHTNGLLGPPRLGNVALLMGIRAQESMTRRRAVTLNREVNYLIKYDDGSSEGNVWKSYPIYDWTTDDVWTAPALKGWDYNRAYDLMEMAGISHHAQRCSPAFGEEPIQKLFLYAQCFPDVWDRMTDRVPGVGAAARYARTELYGFGDLPVRPDELTWPDFLRHYLTKHPPKVARSIGHRLFDIIRRHYRKTTTPIVPHAANPESGVSWGFLLMIAMRGDFKERKQPGFRASRDPEKMPRLWQRYCDELDELLEAGEFGSLGHPTGPPASAYELVPPEFRHAVVVAE